MEKTQFFGGGAYFSGKTLFLRETYFSGETLFAGKTYLAGETLFWGEKLFSGKAASAVAVAAAQIISVYKDIHSLFINFIILKSLPFRYTFQCYETIAQNLIKIPYNLSQSENYDVRAFFSRRFLFMRFIK